MNMRAAFGPEGVTRAQTLTSLADIEKLSSVWQALGERSCVPAGFHVEGWLRPALTHFWASRPAQLVAVWRGATLCGLLALKAGRGRVRRSWTSPLTFLGTPLIDQDLPGDVLATFLTALRDNALVLSKVPATGPFWDMLERAVAEAQRIDHGPRSLGARSARAEDHVRGVVCRQLRAQKTQGIQTSQVQARRGRQARKPRLGAKRSSRSVDRRSDRP